MPFGRDAGSGRDSDCHVRNRLVVGVDTSIADDI
jgi:hypothetical protein